MRSCITAHPPCDRNCPCLPTTEHIPLSQLSQNIVYLEVDNSQNPKSCPTIETSHFKCISLDEVVMQPRNLAASSAVCQQVDSLYQSTANFQQAVAAAHYASPTQSLLRAPPTCSPSYSLATDQSTGLPMHNLLSSLSQHRRFSQPSGGGGALLSQFTDVMHSQLDAALLYGTVRPSPASGLPSRPLPHSQSSSNFHHLQRLPLHQRQYDLQTGMKDVPIWLKTLRLHKYTPLIASMSYEQMMNLNDEQLEQLQVTKGARRKILQSVEKLNERPKILREWQANLSNRQKDACIRCAICVIRQMLSTPLKGLDPEGKANGNELEAIDGLLQPFATVSDKNIPALLVRTVAVIQQHIFPSSKFCAEIEDEYLLMLFSIFDRIINNEAFTIAQKQRVLQWKKLARKFVCPSELRKQRMPLPYAGKCDQCHAKEQLMQKMPSNAIDPQIFALFQQFCQIMQLPADRENLHRFCILLQQSAAAQQLQANPAILMAASLQSQANQILSNHIIAVQHKQRQYQQMIQQNILESSPQKRLPWRHIHEQQQQQQQQQQQLIPPMGCSQQARKSQFQAINIPQYRSASKISMANDVNAIPKGDNRIINDAENIDHQRNRKASEPIQANLSTANKDAITSSHTPNAAALQQKTINAMMQQRNQQQPHSAPVQPVNMQCWPSAIYSSNDIVTLQNQIKEQFRDVNALNLAMNPWGSENEATSGYSSCTSERGSCSGAGSPRTRHESSGLATSTLDGFNHAIFMPPPTPTPTLPTVPVSSSSASSSPRRPSAVFPEPLNTSSLTLGDMDPQFERAFNILFTNLNLNSA